MFHAAKNTEMHKYDVLDGCYGVVTSRSRNDVYLTLDNGEYAFAHKFGNLLPGTEVLCMVKRLATDEKRMLVCIESVTRYPEAA
ncbi:MAG: hypothetical protein IJY28_05600 [Clostridia bacterium]|nr:hypothetical protein [Clostridia bacterium]